MIWLLAVALSSQQLVQEAKTVGDVAKLEKQAAAGDARSQFRLGVSYEFGWNKAPKDMAKALHWIE